MFGLWSACQSIGNIMGACLAALVVEQGYEVRPRKVERGIGSLFDHCKTP